MGERRQGKGVGLQHFYSHWPWSLGNKNETLLDFLFYFHFVHAYVLWLSRSIGLLARLSLSHQKGLHPKPLNEIVLWLFCCNVGYITYDGMRHNFLWCQHRSCQRCSRCSISTYPLWTKPLSGNPTCMIFKTHLYVDMAQGLVLWASPVWTWTTNYITMWQSPT